MLGIFPNGQIFYKLFPDGKAGISVFGIAQSQERTLIGAAPLTFDESIQQCQSLSRPISWHAVWLSEMANGCLF